MADETEVIQGEIVFGQTVEQQAERFNVEPDVMSQVVKAMMTQEPAIVVEERRFEIDSDARALFHELYAAEVKRLETCPWLVPFVKGKKKLFKVCGVALDSIEHALVHHRLHLLFAGDSRTQRSANLDIQTLLFPERSTGVTAALPASERRAMLETDSHLRKRLEARRRE